jgi:Zn-dependent peptidase ImmA (M78 family)
VSGWNAWAWLRARPSIELRWSRAPDGATGGWFRENGRDVIALSARLRRRERHATLTHEAVHYERGIPAAQLPPAMRVKEEAIVEKVATRRLVPPDELEAFLERRASTGDPVTPYEVAEEFDVPEAVAERACRLLTQASVNRHPSSRR